jgi:hypothetical protein
MEVLIPAVSRLVEEEGQDLGAGKPMMSRSTLNQRVFLVMFRVFVPMRRSRKSLKPIQGLPKIPWRIL